MKYVLILLLALTGYAFAGTSTDTIACEKKDDGYLPYNRTKGFWIGAGNLFEKGDCQKLLYTYTALDSVDVICSWQGKGYTVYNSSTGEILNGRNDNYWFNLSTCQRAVTAQNHGLICTPRSTGSGVYDATNGYFIGDGYYFDVENCGIATSYSKPETVCTLVQGGYSQIYNRNFNVPWSTEQFLTALQCGKENIK